MAPALGDVEEVKARASKIKLALLDVKRALRHMEKTGEYNDRIESLENTLDDIPTSSGVFPPESGSTAELEGDDLLSALNGISNDIESIKQEGSYDQEEINSIIERADEIHEVLDRIDDISPHHL